MNHKKQPLKKLTTPTSRRAQLPMACYGLALVLWVVLGVFQMAGDAMAGLQEYTLEVTDFQLVGLESTGAHGVLQTTNGDPQMLLDDLPGAVRTVSYSADFAGGEPREMCLYYTTKVGQPYSQERRVFPEIVADGSYRYTLPRGSIAALRLDPCSPDEGKSLTVAFPGVNITLNRAADLPKGLDYFIPSWYQCFCLILYPALAAAVFSWLLALWRKFRS